jgi:hypothetical protein
MPFQSNVKESVARGVSGQRYGGNPVTHLLPTPKAGAGGVIVGRFVWLDPSDTTGQSVINSGTGRPAGLAQRNRVHPLPAGQEASMLIPEGSPVAVVTSGDLIIASGTAATPGQKVFATLATGVPVSGAAGTTVSGAVESNFMVREGAAVNEPFLSSTVPA